MANPYAIAFADDSGTVRLEGTATFTDAGNQPGGFSGGTITGAVEIAQTDAAAIDLKIVSAGEAVDYSDVLRLFANPGAGADLILALDSAGELSLLPRDPAADGLNVKLQAGSTGRPLQVRKVATNLLVDSDGTTELQPETSLAAAGPVLRVRDEGGNAIFEVRNDGSVVIDPVGAADTALVAGTAATQLIGFYGAAPIARPTGVAVDAAGIHAALVSLGLIAA